VPVSPWYMVWTGLGLWKVNIVTGLWLPLQSLSICANALQVLISIQSMILCEEPYLNEPGWGNDGGTPQSRQCEWLNAILTIFPDCSVRLGQRPEDGR